MQESISARERELREVERDYIMSVNTDIQISDVILTDENKAKVRGLLEEYENLERFQKYNEEQERNGYGRKKLYPTNKVLMHGASGTGKTFLTKALSNRLGAKMLYIDIAKALSDNEAATKLSTIFELAKINKPCVLFLDECDSIAMTRYHSQYGDESYIRRATNSLFQQLDQMDWDILFVAATNLKDKIDPALETRMHLQMQFLRPTMDIEEALEAFKHDRFTIIDDVEDDIREVLRNRLEANENLSYRGLQWLVEKLMKKALIAGTWELSLKEMYSEISLMLNSPFSEEVMQRDLDNWGV